MSRPKRYYVRRFLNTPRFHAGAYILATVEDSTDAPLSRNWSDIICEITDCSERINLNFDLGNARHRKNSIKKADLLVEVFTEFAAALRMEAATVAEREAMRKKEDRKNPEKAKRRRFADLMDDA